MGLLEGVVDRFSGVTVTSFPKGEVDFRSSLTESLKAWGSSGKRGVWLKFPVLQSSLVAIAVGEFGFRLHHCKATYIMCTKWVDAKSPDMLPNFATHMVGIGGLVLNSKRELLCVSERFSSRGLSYKLPGGMLDPGESLPEGVEREVLEETGIHVKFQCLTGLRHNPVSSAYFENGDMYFCAVCSPVDESEAIQMDGNEISACLWVPLETYLNDPNVFPFNKSMVRAALAAIDRGSAFLPTELGTSPYYKAGAQFYTPKREAEGAAGD